MLEIEMLKKITINCFLVAWLVVLAIDAAPDAGAWHRNLKTKLDPYLDVTGLWQGNWQLFAPQPDSVNCSIIAELTFADGHKMVLQSPEWRTLSATQRFLRFREAEFVDSVRQDANRAAWSGLGRYLQRTVPHPDYPDQRPTVVMLTRKLAHIPPPNQTNIKQFPELPEVTETFVMWIDDEFEP